MTIIDPLHTKHQDTTWNIIRFARRLVSVSFNDQTTNDQIISPVLEKSSTRLRCWIGEYSCNVLYHEIFPATSTP